MASQFYQAPPRADHSHYSDSVNCQTGAGKLHLLSGPVVAASSSDTEQQGSVLTAVSVGPLTSGVAEFESAARLSAAEDWLPVAVGS